MTDKYISINGSGILTEVTGTVTSSGAGNSGNIVALDSTGKLDVSTMPTGFGLDTVSLTASEAISAGNMVNIWRNGSIDSARNADCSNNRLAHGFVSSSVSSSGTATVYVAGPNSSLSGLTAGTTYYLNTAGSITSTAPTTSGYSLQQVGVASSATTLVFDPKSAITRA